MLDLVSDLNHTPIFEWYVVWCGSTMDTKKTCVLKEEKFELRAQNVITILGSTINIIGWTYMCIQ